MSPMKSYPQGSRLSVRRVLDSGVVLLFALLMSSCASTEELEQRLEKRNERYSSLQERREMRQDARQERTDAWFDRVMH